MRLVDQVKTIAEQRIYLDEANELYTLLTEKWIQVTYISTSSILYHNSSGSTYYRRGKGKFAVI